MAYNMSNVLSFVQLILSKNTHYFSLKNMQIKQKKNLYTKKTNKKIKMVHVLSEKLLIL